MRQKLTKKAVEFYNMMVGICEAQGFEYSVNCKLKNGKISDLRFPVTFKNNSAKVEMYGYYGESMKLYHYVLELDTGGFRKRGVSQVFSFDQCKSEYLNPNKVLGMLNTPPSFGLLQWNDFIPDKQLERELDDADTTRKSEIWRKMDQFSISDVKPKIFILKKATAKEWNGKTVDNDGQYCIFFYNGGGGGPMTDGFLYNGTGWLKVYSARDNVNFSVTNKDLPILTTKHQEKFDHLIQKYKIDGGSAL